MYAHRNLFVLGAGDRAKMGEILSRVIRDKFKKRKRSWDDKEGECKRLNCDTELSSGNGNPTALLERWASDCSRREG